MTEKSARILARLEEHGFGATIDEILTGTAVTRAELVSDSRYADIVRARHRLWLAMRARGLSYPRIGEMVERDHTTVMAGVRKAMPKSDNDRTAA